MKKIIPFSDLSESDLFVDAIYEGGNRGNAGDDPINKLVRSGNQGGFRYVGTLNCIKLCVLYSELTDPNWPDLLDSESGRFVYYGDNKNPGHALHETKRKGNLVLKHAFSSLHLGRRKVIPPFFIFTKGVKGRDVVFRGLAVPGAQGLSHTEDLVAIWKTDRNERFQNYRAVFTILDADPITAAWIDDVHHGSPLSKNSPKVWVDWIKGGGYHALLAPRSIAHRSKAEQLPETELQRKIVDCVVTFFKNHTLREYAFEKCAAEIVKLMDPNVSTYDLTRFWRDGGRDAIGRYRIGTDATVLRIEFALEAKCKNLTNGSGVRETSRLISRLRQREFGIFVTTSYVNEQAYKEIVEDGHPVIILSGKDIADILVRSGYNSVELIFEWLRKNFS